MFGTPYYPVLLPVLGIMFSYCILKKCKAVQAEKMNFVIPTEVYKLFEREYPEISAEHKQLAFDGLKEFFGIYYLAKKKYRKNVIVAMPSELVDKAWHCFVLNTKAYSKFCTKHFGEFVDHNPDPSANPQEMTDFNKVSRPVRNTFYFAKVFEPELKKRGVPTGKIFTADAQVGQGWIWGAAILMMMHSDITAFTPPTQKETEGSGSSCGTGFTAAQSATADSGNSCSSDGSSSGSSCGSGCGGD